MKYFKRDVIEIEFLSMKEQYKNHMKLIFMPYEGAEGHGIEIFSINDKKFFCFLGYSEIYIYKYFLLKRC